MRDYYFLDEDFLEVKKFDESLGAENKKKNFFQKVYRAVKVVAIMFLGPGFMRATYKTSDAKDRNTNYIDRF